MICLFLLSTRTFINENNLMTYRVALSQNECIIAMSQDECMSRKGPEVGYGMLDFVRIENSLTNINRRSMFIIKWGCNYDYIRG